MDVPEYIDALSEDQRAVATALVALIEAELPGRGAVWQGHPVWSLGTRPGQQPVCFVKAYPRYVTLGFWRGQAIPDPGGRLEPGSREMASVKLRTIEDVDLGLFTAWVHAARDLG